MSENIKLPSNKSFGLLFFVVFMGIAIYQYSNIGKINVYLISISLIFLVLGILNSRALTPFNKLWMKLGFLLGKIVAPIVMGVVFFFVITPIALLLRFFKKDVINLKKNKSTTYWIKKSDIISKMKDQF